MQDAGLNVEYLRRADDADAPSILLQIATARGAPLPTQAYLPERRLPGSPETLDPPPRTSSAELPSDSPQPGLPYVHASTDQFPVHTADDDVALAGTRCADNMPSPGSPSLEPVEMAASPATGERTSTAVGQVAMTAPCPVVMRKLKRDIAVDSAAPSDYGVGQDSAGVMADASSQQEEDICSPLPGLPGLGQDPLSVCPSDLPAFWCRLGCFADAIWACSLAFRFLQRLVACLFSYSPHADCHLTSVPVAGCSACSHFCSLD